MELKKGELPCTFGDEVLIRQVLLNLLGNAFNFSGQRKTTLVEIGNEVKKTETVYSIKDNGAGFQYEVL